MKHKSTHKLLIVGIVTTVILGIGLITGLILLLISLNNAPSSTPTLNENDLQTISQVIKFNDTQSDNYIYQSYLYDFEVGINTKKYQYSETSHGLTVSDQNIDNLVSFDITENTDNTGLSEASTDYIDSVKYLKSYSLAKEESIVIDGVQASKISFTYKNYNNSNITVTTAVITTPKFIYNIEYTNYDSSLQDNALFESLITSFKFVASGNINSVVDYESSLWGYSYSYDAKYWIQNHTDYSSTLTQRDYQSDYADQIQIDFSSTEISRTDLAGNEATYLKDAFTQKVGEITTSTYQKNTVTATGDMTVAGRSAKFVDYTRTTTYPTAQYYKEIYLVHYNALTKITVNYGSVSLLDGLNTVLATFEVSAPTSGVVKGVTSSTQSDEKTAILAKPAVVQIFFQKCGTLYMHYEADYPNTTGKSYDLCAAATGSGFYVNSTGYVATNGHVVSMDATTYKTYAASKKLYVNLFKDFILPRLQEADPVKYANMTDAQIITYLKNTPADAQNIVLVSAYLVDLAYTSMNFSETAYVQKGSNSFQTGTDTTNLANTSDHLKAEIIDMDYSTKLDADGKETASDVALLKVEPGDYPILHLGSNEFTVSGTPIMAIGFPGAADSLALIDTSVTSEATFTKGVVSRIVDTTGGRKIIQIDASINHGNSGGPLISAEDGTVLGLNTYGSDAGASDFNYARDVADLKALMTKNHIENTAGVTQQKLEEGVNFFFDGYFSKAVTSLEAAQASYTDIEGLNTVIALAQDKVAQGLDKIDPPPKSTDIISVFNDLPSTEKILYIVVACLICLVVFIVFGMLIVFNRLRRVKKTETPSDGPYTQTPPPVSQPQKDIPGTVNKT